MNWSVSAFLGAGNLPLMRLLIDGGGYVEATDAFLLANRAAALRHGDLVAELSAYAAMAGDSSTSADFAATYDAAAADAVGSLADVVAAFTTLGRLTCASLANHSSAEERSVLPGAAVFTGTPLPDGVHASVLPASVPSALGGDPSSLPGELSWVLDHVEGFVWPDADVDKLRAAAATWRAHADGLAALVDHCDLAIAALGREHSPEVPVAIGAVRDLKGTLCDLADQYAAVAGACDGYADQVEEQRAAMLDLLWDLLRDSAIIQGIGLGLSLVTAGATGAAAAGLNAARIAAYAPRILEFVAAVRRAAEAAASVIRVAVSGLGRCRAVLGRFVGVVVAADARALTVAMPQARRQFLTAIIRDPKKFDPDVLRGMSPRDVRRLVDDWTELATRSGEGIRLADPVHDGRRLRIMDGYPGNRPDPLTHGPYAVISQNGDKFKIPLEGNPTL